MHASGASADPVEASLRRGGAVWSSYRQRWILLATASSNSAPPMGEIYYAEAAAVSGPYERAVLVATHNWSQYACYNPVMLPQLDLKGGRFTHFSCTFTDSFSNAPVKVPEYDYNNLVFRIDLDAVGREVPAQYAHPPPMPVQEGRRG